MTAKTFSNFAYGSNMCTKRLQKRVPSARSVSTGFIKGYQLKWHKRSNDGSGKCDIYYTGNENDIVHGVIFEILQSEKRQLDNAEGLGSGYDKKIIKVETDSGTMSAVAYYATAIDESLRPYTWYKRYVVEGAIEHRLPADYIEALKSVEDKSDPKHERAEKETACFKNI